LENFNNLFATFSKICGQFSNFDIFQNFKILWAYLLNIFGIFSKFFIHIFKISNFLDYTFEIFQNSFGTFSNLLGIFSKFEIIQNVLSPF
jgi:hypothetical protein